MQLTSGAHIASWPGVTLDSQKADVRGVLSERRILAKGRRLQTYPSSRTSSFVRAFPLVSAISEYCVSHLLDSIRSGPEVELHEREAKKTTQERGLLFACYQSSIEQGFQFVQKLWANNSQFPFGNIAGIGTPGQDLVIGQVAQGGRTIQGIKPNVGALPSSVSTDQ